MSITNVDDYDDYITNKVDDYIANAVDDYIVANSWLYSYIAMNPWLSC